MIDQDYRDRFARIFRMNVERRSRTAKGKDEGSKTSSKKRPLLLQGEALKAKVAENVERLIEEVTSDAVRVWFSDERIKASAIRSRCERWYDIACAGLIDDAGYVPDFDAFDAAAYKVGRVEFKLNRRYRTWTPGYTVLQIPPVLIDDELRELYVHLGLHLSVIAPRSQSTEREQLASLLSYADVQMDGEIHPWIDGCSRVSTALIMWLSAIYGETPPLFAPTKDEHYRDIRDLEAHAEYFIECLKRADREAP